MGEILMTGLGGETMVRINGEDINAEDMRLTDYLAENGYMVERIAIEYNGEILSKSEYEKTILKKDDVVEIVSFVGGGR